MKKSKLYRKIQEAWTKTADGVILKYPIFHHNLSVPDDPTIKSTINDVIGDVDFWGWKGNEEDRIIDSTGKVYLSRFEETAGTVFFIIRTIRQSGVFPDKLERIMDLWEVKTIMLSAIERNLPRIKDDVNELKMKIDSIDSIQKILETCSKYF